MSAKKQHRTKNPLRCPLMNREEASSITVPFNEISQNLKNTISEHGVAIISNCITEHECTELESSCLADFTELINNNTNHSNPHLHQTAISATKNLSSMPTSSLRSLGQENKDRNQLRGLPHGRFAWRARLHPNIRRVYEILHDTDDLVSSCDNTFFAPSSQAESIENRNWPHVDQNCHNDIGRLDVYQGLLYVWSSENSHASTTVVWTKSHMDVYDTLMSDPAITRHGKHFSMLSAMTAGPTKDTLIDAWYRNAKRVPVPRGALFLWSSKTLHQGWRGGPRLAQPVCWEPRERRSWKARDRKIRLAALGLPSTHSASLGEPHSLVKMRRPMEVVGEVRGRGDYVLGMKSMIEPVSIVGVKCEEMWDLLEDKVWEKSLKKDELRRVISVMNPEIVHVL